MTERPALPPLLRPLAVRPNFDPFARGIKVAGEGARAGTLLWSHGQDTCACAVVLAPERPLEPSLPIVLIAMLALAEGLGALAPPLVAVTFGRHFLGWINRWQEDGVRPVKQAWQSRATGLGKHVEIRFDDQVRTGTFEGLTETGAMRPVRGEVAQTIALDEPMKTPTKSL